MLLCVVPLAAVLIGAGLALPHSFPARTWLYVVPSGLIGGAYTYFLARAYSSSDFSVVYPLTRALPVLLVAGVDVLRGHRPSSLGWLAMLLVVAGCLLAPQTSYRGFDLRRYHWREVLWILLTAGGVAGFTVLDKLAAEIVRRGPGSAAVYCGLWHIGCCMAYLALHGPLGGVGRGQAGWAMPAVAALMGLFTYTLVLWAFQLAPQASYLLAFRQFSIVAGVAASIALHREGALGVRVPATAAIVAGLVLLALRG
jgi:uncharacterized membrane protein